MEVSEPKRVGRRSEVDRRLYMMVGTESGRLRDSSTENIVRVLRLFNLCDIGPSSSAVEVPSPEARPSLAAVAAPRLTATDSPAGSPVAAQAGSAPPPAAGEASENGAAEAAADSDAARRETGGQATSSGGPEPRGKFDSPVLELARSEGGTGNGSGSERDRSLTRRGRDRGRSHRDKDNWRERDREG